MRSDQRFGPVREFHALLRSTLCGGEAGAERKRSCERRSVVRIPRQAKRAFDAGSREPHALLASVKQSEPLREKALVVRPRGATGSRSLASASSEPYGGFSDARDGLSKTRVDRNLAALRRPKREGQSSLRSTGLAGDLLKVGGVFAVQEADVDAEGKGQTRR